MVQGHTQKYSLATGESSHWNNCSSFAYFNEICRSDLSINWTVLVHTECHYYIDTHKRSHTFKYRSRPNRVSVDLSSSLPDIVIDRIEDASSGVAWHPRQTFQCWNGFRTCRKIRSGLEPRKNASHNQSDWLQSRSLRTLSGSSRGTGKYVCLRSSANTDCVQVANRKQFSVVTCMQNTSLACSLMFR